MSDSKDDKAPLGGYNPALMGMGTGLLMTQSPAAIKAMGMGSLYHGTSMDNLDSILGSGMNLRYAGQKKRLNSSMMENAWAEIASKEIGDFDFDRDVPLLEKRMRSVDPEWKRSKMPFDKYVSLLRETGAELDPKKVQDAQDLYLNRKQVGNAMRKMVNALSMEDLGSGTSDVKLIEDALKSQGIVPDIESMSTRIKPLEQPRDSYSRMRSRNSYQMRDIIDDAISQVDDESYKEYASALREEAESFIEERSGKRPDPSKVDDVLKRRGKRLYFGHSPHTVVDWGSDLTEGGMMARHAIENGASKPSVWKKMRGPLDMMFTGGVVGVAEDEVIPAYKYQQALRSAPSKSFNGAMPDISDMIGTANLENISAVIKARPSGSNMKSFKMFSDFPMLSPLMSSAYSLKDNIKEMGLPNWNPGRDLSFADNLSPSQIEEVQLFDRSTGKVLGRLKNEAFEAPSRMARIKSGLPRALAPLALTAAGAELFTKGLTGEGIVSRLSPGETDKTAALAGISGARALKVAVPAAALALPALAGARYLRDSIEDRGLSKEVGAAVASSTTIPSVVAQNVMIAGDIGGLMSGNVTPKGMSNAMHGSRYTMGGGVVASVGVGRGAQSMSEEVLPDGAVKKIAPYAEGALLAGALAGAPVYVANRYYPIHMERTKSKVMGAIGELSDIPGMSRSGKMVRLVIPSLMAGGAGLAIASAVKNWDNSKVENLATAMNPALVVGNNNDMNKKASYKWPLLGAGALGSMEIAKQMSEQYAEGESEVRNVDPYRVARAAAVGGAIGLAAPKVVSAAGDLRTHLVDNLEMPARAVAEAAEEYKNLASKAHHNLDEVTRNTARMADDLDDLGRDVGNLAESATGVTEKARNNRFFGIFSGGDNTPIRPRRNGPLYREGIEARRQALHQMGKTASLDITVIKLAGGPGSGVGHNNTEDIKGYEKSPLISISKRKAFMEGKTPTEKRINLDRVKFVSQDKYVVKKLASLMSKRKQDWVDIAIDVLEDDDRRIHIMDGHHRFLAARRLGIKSLPANVYKWKQEKVAYEMTRVTQHGVRGPALEYSDEFKDSMKERSKNKRNKEFLNSVPIGAGLGGLAYAGLSKNKNPIALGASVAGGALLGAVPAMSRDRKRGRFYDSMKSLRGWEPANDGDFESAENRLIKRYERLESDFKKERGEDAQIFKKASGDGDVLTSSSLLAGMSGAGLANMLQSATVNDFQAVGKSVPNWLKRKSPFLAGGALAGAGIDWAVRNKEDVGHALTPWSSYPIAEDAAMDPDPGAAAEAEAMRRIVPTPAPVTQAPVTQAPVTHVEGLNVGPKIPTIGMRAPLIGLDPKMAARLAVPGGPGVMQPSLPKKSLRKQVRTVSNKPKQVTDAKAKEMV